MDGFPSLRFLEEVDENPLTWEVPNPPPLPETTVCKIPRPSLFTFPRLCFSQTSPPLKPSLKRTLPQAYDFFLRFPVGQPLLQHGGESSSHVIRTFAGLSSPLRTLKAFFELVRYDIFWFFPFFFARDCDRPPRFTFFLSVSPGV